jgi:hypothetical protein
MLRARLAQRIFISISMPASLGTQIRGPRLKTGCTSRGPLLNPHPGPWDLHVTTRKYLSARVRALQPGMLECRAHVRLKSGGSACRACTAMVNLGLVSRDCWPSRPGSCRARWAWQVEGLHGAGLYQPGMGKRDKNQSQAAQPAGLWRICEVMLGRIINLSCYGIQMQILPYACKSMLLCVPKYLRSSV